MKVVGHELDISEADARHLGKFPQFYTGLQKTRTKCLMGSWKEKISANK